MNPELIKQALEIVGNPNVLINIVSRRVKQMNGGGGGMGRPLIEEHANLGAADVALTEIIQKKIDWQVVDEDTYVGAETL